MTKAKAADVAARALELAHGTPISYAELDCQAFVERCVNDCGGALSAAGSNDMARNHCAWLGTLANAKADGKLVPGAMLLIHEDSEADLPARYQGDGLGDFSHIGVCCGSAGVCHSSKSRGGVVIGSYPGTWTHCMWMPEIDYGTDVQPGVTLGVDLEFDTDEPVVIEAAGFTPYTAIVCTPDGNPVKFRAKPSKLCPLYKKIQNGLPVLVVGKENDTWVKVSRNSRQWFVMSKFLRRVSHTGRLTFTSA